MLKAVNWGLDVEVIEKSSEHTPVQPTAVHGRNDALDIIRSRDANPVTD